MLPLDAQLLISSGAAMYWFFAAFVLFVIVGIGRELRSDSPAYNGALQVLSLVMWGCAGIAATLAIIALNNL